MEACSFELHTDRDLTFQELVVLYDSVGWTAYTASQWRADLPKAVANSSFVVTARVGGEMVGLARGLSDDVSIFYLQDVLVAPEYQHQGIGTRLVQACLERYKHVRMCVLLTDEDERLSRFHESLGFRNARDAQDGPLNAFIRIERVKLG